MLPVPYPLIAVMGPTAVGKTELTLRLAREINAEIINVDSIQIYRWLDIGSAKPSGKELNLVPHHLVDIRYPFEPFDAADFARCARLAARNIMSRGKAVILAGGTGLYLNAFLNGLAPCSGAHPCLRMMLRRYSDQYGADSLHAMLAEHDPAAAGRIHPNDSFRVIRALEVLFSTGRPVSMWRSSGSPSGRMQCLKIVLIRSRQELYQRIDRRVDIMIEQGFIDEVRGLLARGCSPGLKPLQSLGYRHIIEFLQGMYSLDETIYRIKRDTRRYAKRQLTWFRRERNINWFHPEYLMDSSGMIRKIAERCAAV